MAKTRIIMALEPKQGGFYWWQCRSIEQAQKYAKDLAYIGRTMVLAINVPIEKLSEEEAIELWDRIKEEAKGNEVDPNMA